MSEPMPILPVHALPVTPQTRPRSQVIVLANGEAKHVRSPSGHPPAMVVRKGDLKWPTF